MEKLSANQRWKKSGTTLPFKEWINRENEKEKATENSLIPFEEEPNNFEKNFQNFDTNQQISDTIDSTISGAINTYQPTPVVTQDNPNQVLGLDKKIFIFSSLLIVGSLSFYFYKRLKDKK